MPRDAVLHEFRSLVLFALHRYPESAAAIPAVLDVGPGWDWKTLSSLYPEVDVYTKQLRALEAARDKDPKAADVRFLVGYHYLTIGSPEAALKAFQRASELQPKDAVAAALVATLSPREAQPTKATTTAASFARNRTTASTCWTERVAACARMVPCVSAKRMLSADMRPSVSRLPARGTPAS